MNRKNILLICLFVALCGVAAWLWSAPYRAERALKSASLETLEREAEKQPYNPRVHYYLGVRARELGQMSLAHKGFRHAAELDDNDETSWLAAADAAGIVTGDQEVLGILTTYLQKHPDSPRAHFALAELYQQRNAFKRAYEEAMEAVKHDGTKADYWRLAGTIAQRLAGLVQMAGISQEWQQKGLEALSKAAQLAPNDWRIRISYGNILLEAKKLPEAVTEYREAVKIAPEEATTHLALGRALLIQAKAPSEIETARQSIAKSLELGTQLPQAYSLLGQSYLRENRWKEAQSALENAQNLMPTNPDIAFSLARIYRNLGDSQRAEAQTLRHKNLQEYLLKKSQLIARMQEATDPEAPLALARFCQKQGEFVEAAAFYRRAVTLGPNREDIKQELAALEQNYPEAIQRRVFLSSSGSPGTTAPISTLLRDADRLFEQKKYVESSTAYQKVLEREQSSAQAFQGVGLSLIAQGKQAEAFPYLNTATRLNPGLALAQFHIARILNQSGFPAQAVLRLKRATEADPEKSAFWYALGLAYRDRPNSNNLAAEGLSRAVRLDPRNPILLNDYAETLQEIQQSADAEKQFRLALSLAPENPDIKAKFGMFLLNYQPTPLRQKEAEGMLQQALVAMPEDPYVLFGLGRAALVKGEAKEAIPFFERSLAIAPKTASVWYWLARASQRAGDTTKAKKAMAENQRLQDSFIARSVAEEEARDHPQDVTRQLKLAHLCVQGQEYARAISLYQRVLILMPGNVPIKSEMEALTTRLQAAGQMPDMDAFKAMVSAFETTR